MHGIPSAPHTEVLENVLIAWRSALRLLLLGLRQSQHTRIFCPRCLWRSIWVFSNDPHHCSGLSSALDERDKSLVSNFPRVRRQVTQWSGGRRALLPPESGKRAPLGNQASLFSAQEWGAGKWKLRTALPFLDPSFIWFLHLFDRVSRVLTKLLPTAAAAFDVSVKVTRASSTYSGILLMSRFISWRQTEQEENTAGGHYQEAPARWRGDSAAQLTCSTVSLRPNWTWMYFPDPAAAKFCYKDHKFNPA